MSDYIEIPKCYLNADLSQDTNYSVFRDFTGELYIVRNTMLAGDKDMVVAVNTNNTVQDREYVIFGKGKDIKSIPGCVIIGVATHKIQPLKRRRKS